VRWTRHIPDRGDVLRPKDDVVVGPSHGQHAASHGEGTMLKKPLFIAMIVAGYVSFATALIVASAAETGIAAGFSSIRSQ
jgi:hypothetical protein